ncbi:two-component regulator propeller domain-containing protein [Oceanihabitans sediminis]|uniref:ligand-binding sensor domain-containing protein n=2 Tax=Flavobacteriaceae TaxID=49546 RepID=UPI00299ED21E|nr:two-component regulator propeller domain-containing protein [Oceanihabitans sediminis]
MITQLKSIVLLFILIFMSSCKGQKESGLPTVFEANKFPLNKTTNQVHRDDRDVVTNGLLDKNGDMWFTTLTEGVYKYDGSSFVNFTTQDGLCSNKVNAVIEDKDGVLWFATSKGLCRFNGETFTTIPLPQDDALKVSPITGLPSRTTQEVLSLIQDSKGGFWLGTLASGAYYFDGETFTSYLRFKGRIHPDDKVYNNVIQSIVEDDFGNIWLTSQTHGGITRYDGNGFTNYSLKDGLTDDMVFSSFNDRDGTLWFGTLDNGLMLYKDGGFKFYDETNGLNNNMVSCFYQDQSGKLWIGSFRESTVTWFDGEAFSVVPFDKDQKLVELRFIAGDKDGNVWFGGRYGLLYRYDGTELKDFTHLKRMN